MQKSKNRLPTSKSTAQRVRGRPREFDREAALARATRLFWLKGYEATSISDLTEVMGINSPSLYAAFGSKEKLYAEALHYYNKTYEALVWGNFFSSATAREAVISLLMDSAAALSGSLCDIPHGCMITLSAVGSEGHLELGEMVRAARAVSFNRLKQRLERAVAEGEFPATIDVQTTARFIQTVQCGMSVLARDGASRDDLEAVARMATTVVDASAGSAFAP